MIQKRYAEFSVTPRKFCPSVHRRAVVTRFGPARRFAGKEGVVSGCYDHPISIFDWRTRPGIRQSTEFVPTQTLPSGVKTPVVFTLSGDGTASASNGRALARPTPHSGKPPLLWFPRTPFRWENRRDNVCLPTLGSADTSLLIWFSFQENPRLATIRNESKEKQGPSLKGTLPCSLDFQNYFVAY